MFEFKFFERRTVAYAKLRQHCRIVFFLFIFLVILVNSCKTSEFRSFTADFKLIILCFYVDYYRIESRFAHLTGEKSLIDKLIQFITRCRNHILYAFRRSFECYRSYRFMRILRSLFACINVRFSGYVFFSVLSKNILSCVFLCICRDTHAVGTNVGYQSNLSLALDSHAFI